MKYKELILNISLYLGFIFILDFFLHFIPCKEIVFNELYSPNNQYIAQHYDTDCGATTGFSRQVRLRENNKVYLTLISLVHKLLPGFYQTLLAHQGTVLVIDDSQPIKMKWLGSKKLLLTYPKDKRVYFQEKKWQNVAIIYYTE